MLKRRDIILAALANLAMAQMSVAKTTKRIPRYSGPKITRVVVNKSKRRIYLLSDDVIVKRFRIALGFSPKGHKQREGDGKTPEGKYIIDIRNPQSKYFLSLRISYPNADDRARAERIGDDPGGDIYIHGTSQLNRKRTRGKDWTDGCIAVSNRKMAWIYAMVDVGTPIYIKA